MEPRKMTPGGPDFRLRVRVYMIAAERPRHQNFYCNGCGQKLAEIDDTVVYLTDSADETTVPINQGGAITVKCPGKWCRRHYEFVIRPKQ